MPRLWLLVCLLLLMVFTSQFDWKQQYGNEREDNPSTSQKLKQLSEIDDSVKEKALHWFLSKRRVFRDSISLSSLREQLLQCKGENEVSNTTTITLTEVVTEFERQPELEN